MAKFYIGQRVRILYSTGWPELAGQEGRIESPMDDRLSVDERPGDWYVAPDCWGSSKAPYRGLNGGAFFCPGEDQLEPLCKDDDQVGSWDALEELGLDVDAVKETVRA